MFDIRYSIFDVRRAASESTSNVDHRRSQCAARAFHRERLPAAPLAWVEARRRQEAS